MTSINEFKNKLQAFQEGVDYTYDEGKKTYIIRHEKLKNNFWGDASSEVEYKAIEDSRGNMQFRKSATFRSSKAIKEENDQVPFVHSTEKMRDKQWQEKNLALPKKNPDLSPVSESSRNNFKESPGFEGIEEEFGYYKQWKGWKEPFEEPINTAYYRKKEEDVFVEEKAVWKDNSSQKNITVKNEFISSADKSIEERQQPSQAGTQSTNPQHRTNSEIIQDIRQNPRNWRIDEIIVDLGENRQERVLIHQSARLDDYNQQTGKLNFDGNTIYRSNRFSAEEQTQINQALNVSQQPAQQQQKPYKWSWQ